MDALPTGTAVAEIINWPQPHSITSGSGSPPGNGNCQTTAGACLDIVFFGNATGMLVDMTTPGAGEAYTRWASATGTAVHQYVITLNRTAANMQLYMDGTLQTITVSAQSSDPGPLWNGAVSQPWITLMAAQNNGSNVNFAKGKIADVGIWQVILTANEAASLGHCVPPNRVRPESLVAYWPLYGTDSPEPEYKPTAPLSTFPIDPMVLTGTTPAPGIQAGCAPGGAYR